MVVAFLLEEGDRCQQCGTKDSEWAADRFAYTAEPHTCMGCYYQDKAREDIDSQTMPGTTVRLVANTPQRRAEQAAQAAKMREKPQE